MTFVELYADALDRELASADRNALFTVVRRKYAVNEAQREFTRLTDCYLKEVTIPLVDGTRRVRHRSRRPGLLEVQ